MSNLRCTDVSIRLHKRTVVQDFSANVEPGSWLCLIGPNGAGKSSLLKAVAGLIKYSGEVTIGDEEVHKLKARRRSQLISYVPQTPIFPLGMNGFEYVLLGRNPYVSHFGYETSEDRQIVADVLTRLELDSLANRDVSEMSGGERQRFAIARAIAQGSPVLLLDEPTSALDLGNQQLALELVERLRSEMGLTVISAMHDLTLAGLYSDQLLLLHEGTTVVMGNADQVLQAETLSEFYGASVRVHRADDGTVVVLPIRNRDVI